MIVIAAAVAAPAHAQQAFVFHGTVVKVNAAGGTVDVKNDTIPGWMAAMSMTYHIDVPAVLRTLKGGDRVIATVYEGDTSKLYQVRVAASPKKPIENALPSISYVCPSPGEESFVDDKPGRCPKSAAQLQPVRLDIAYKCLRTSFVRETPGSCPVDRSDLVPVTASIFWLCKNDPDPEKRYLEPGACRGGLPREKAFEVRPHGDHNPRHGGPTVFMSEDLYHHVEATLVAPTRTRPAIFRAYFYDEYTRPIKATSVSAQVALADQNGNAVADPAPLVLSRIRDGNAMEVRLPSVAVPSDSAPAFFALRVKFKPSDKDWKTDHTFTSYSKEPAPFRSVVTTGIAGQNNPQPPPVASVPPESRGRGPAATTLIPPPDSRQDLLAELRKDMDSVTKEWRNGNLAALWYPALSAKDVVLKLHQNFGNDIPDDRQPELTSAVERLTLSAWQIDSAGDLGNKEKIAVLYEVFHTAVEDVLGLYGVGH